jgi:thiamine biosynthesis protein ThiS
MNVQMNQKQFVLPEKASVSMLLTSQGLGKNVAVWVNKVRLLQREYPVYQLYENDEIRVLRTLGGG